MEYQTEQRQLSSSTLCVKSLATIPPHVYTYVYTLARRSRRVEIRVKLIPTRRSGDTLPFNLPGTASKEPARSARSSSNSLHDIPSSRSLLISNQKCPRGGACVPDANSFPLDATGPRVDVEARAFRGPRRLKVNGQARTCVPLHCGYRGMSPPPPRFSLRFVSFDSCQDWNNSSIRVIPCWTIRSRASIEAVVTLSFRGRRTDLILENGGAREIWAESGTDSRASERKVANPVGQTTANWTATGGRLRFSIGFGLHRMRDHHHGSPCPTRSKRTALARRRESSSFQEFQSDHETVPRTMGNFGSSKGGALRRR